MRVVRRRGGAVRTRTEIIEGGGNRRYGQMDRCWSYGGKRENSATEVASAQPKAWQNTENSSKEVGKEHISQEI